MYNSVLMRPQGLRSGARVPLLRQCIYRALFENILISKYSNKN